jgi:hypothetical protein
VAPVAFFQSAFSQISPTCLASARDIAKFRGGCRISHLRKRCVWINIEIGGQADLRGWFHSGPAWCYVRCFLENSQKPRTWKENAYRDRISQEIEEVSFVLWFEKSENCSETLLFICYLFVTHIQGFSKLQIYNCFSRLFF